MYRSTGICVEIPGMDSKDSMNVQSQAPASHVQRTSAVVHCEYAGALAGTSSDEQTPSLLQSAGHSPVPLPGQKCYFPLIPDTLQ